MESLLKVLWESLFFALVVTWDKTAHPQYVVKEEEGGQPFFSFKWNDENLCIYF